MSRRHRPGPPPRRPTRPPRRGTLAARLALKQRAGGIAVPVVTVVIAFLMGGLVVLATGHNPLLAYRDIFNGAGLNWIFHPTTNLSSTSAYNLSQTLLQTTTLILCGLAVAFAFRCGMFNIGGQGQYFIGLYRRQLDRLDFAGDEPAAAHPARGRRGDARRRGVGRDRRLPEGDRRRPRGDLDDHAQLDRDLGRRMALRRRRAAAELRQQDAPDLERRRRLARSSRSSGASSSSRGSTSASSSRSPRSSSSG